MNITNSILTGSDLPYFFTQTINELTYLPQVWSNTAGYGIGQNVSFILGLNAFYYSLIKLITEFFGLDWYLIEKITFIIPYFIISFLATYLFSSLFFKSKTLKIVSSIIFATNTYSLMIVGGGQFGVSIAFALTPLVLFFLIRLILGKDKFLSRFFLISILILSFQILVDPRLALITIFAVFIYLILSLIVRTAHTSKILSFIGVVVVAVLVNAFWIVPFILSRDLNLATAYTSSDISAFFSFAKLENTIALIHPNYPENIFGKVGFLKFEYLILPIVAFSSLFFVKKNKSEALNLIFLIVIALFGIFLAKGTNYPLGSIYNFILDHVPFATIYRDPMKFYLLIALAYSILIPFTLGELGKILNKKFNLKVFTNLLLIIFISFWFLSIRHLFILGPSGVFNPISPDDEYFKFAQMVSSENEFSRTISVPMKQRFVYNSQLNPAVSLNDYLNEYDHEDLIRTIGIKDFVQEIKESSVRFVVLPYDQEGEIFLEDRNFSQELYDEYLNALNSNLQLKEIEGFGKLKVFEVEDFGPVIYSINENVRINPNYANPINYDFNVSDINEDTEIIFTQSYSPNWVLISDDGKEQNAKIVGRFNKFEISEDGKYKIYYKSQKLVYYGFIITLVSFGVVIVLLFQNLVNKRKK